MKKNILAAFGIIFALASCTKEYEAISTKDYYQEKTKTMIAYSDFMSSVDSINAQFSEGATSTRGLLGVFVGRFADVIGGWVGSKTGTAIGAGLGSITGNPSITIFGGFAGNKYGKSVGATLFSGAVGIFLNETKVDNPNNNYVVVSSGFQNMLELDSLGVHHNRAMVKLASKPNYYTKDWGIEYSSLYEDCVRFMVCDTIARDSLLADSLSKQTVISFLEQSIPSFIQYNNGEISIDSLLSNELELMSVCNIAELDSIQQDIYTTFTKNVMETVQNFNPLEMDTYAQSLSESIRKSRLPKEYKIDLLRTANIILNSTLCWQ